MREETVGLPCQFCVVAPGEETASALATSFGYLVWLGRLRAACGATPSGTCEEWWRRLPTLGPPALPVFDGTIVDKFAVLESVKKVAVCSSCRGQVRTRVWRPCLPLLATPRTTSSASSWSTLAGPRQSASSQFCKRPKRYRSR